MRKEIEIKVTEEIFRKIEAFPGAMDIGKLLRHQAGLTRREIRRAKFREDGIRKNGSRCRVTDPVRPGDLIQVCLEPEENRSDHMETFQGIQSRKLTVVYEDEDLLVAAKPAGMVSHPSGGHYRDTLANLVQSYLTEKNQMCRIRPVGRLDRETSGMVVFAKNQTAAARLAEQRENGKFQKIYTALAVGELPIGSRGCVRQPIGKDPCSRFRMRVDAGGKQAATFWKTEAFGGGLSLLRLRLESGRTHQIRVHMAWMGHPLAGDCLYGGSMAYGMDRTALHAGMVTFVQPFTGEVLKFQDPLPEDMANLASAMGWVPEGIRRNNISGNTVIC